MVSLGKYKNALRSRQFTGTAARNLTSACTRFMHRYRILLLAVRQQTAENYPD
jgi:hypothetical protein